MHLFMAPRQQPVRYLHTSVTIILENLRQMIDARVPGTGCGMRAYTEAPTTPRQWMLFVHRWVFGPSKPTQRTLDRWMPSIIPVGPRIVFPVRPQPSSAEEADLQGQIGRLAATTSSTRHAWQVAAGPTTAIERPNDADNLGARRQQTGSRHADIHDEFRAPSNSGAALA